MNSVVERVINLELDITYEEAKSAAIQVVDLIYNNRDACHFIEFIDSMASVCPEMDEYECMYSLGTNIYKHLFDIINRGLDLFHAMTEANEGDYDILAFADRVAYD